MCLTILIISLAMLRIFIIQPIYASWSEPTAAPPGNNTNPPIDISSSNQNKLGALSVGTTTNFTAAGMYAPIYYDANNTNYYIQPSNTGTSALLAGNLALSGGSITNISGGVGLGAVSSGWYSDNAPSLF